MSQVRALVMTGFGINCEEETAAAYRLVGAKVDIVHLNTVLLGNCSIHDYDVLTFPGGFSFGDDLGAGKALANKLRYRKLLCDRFFFDDLKIFVDEGKVILGICNGFQALVKMGLLPNVNGDYEQEVTLTTNASGHFEDRWCQCTTASVVKTPFLKGIGVIFLPVRHGEGRLVIRDLDLESQIVAQSLNCLSYCDPEGTPTAAYPMNPNGSQLNCAGLCDPTGRIFGMMPHPEAYLSLYNHPNWPRIRRLCPDAPADGEGLRLFKNIVEHIKQR